MKKIFRSVKKYFNHNHDIAFSYDDFYLFEFEINPFSFSICMLKNGRSLIGYFDYYEFVERRRKYIIQLAFCEITVNGKVSK